MSARPNSRLKLRSLRVAGARPSASSVRRVRVGLALLAASVAGVGQATEVTRLALAMGTWLEVTVEAPSWADGAAAGEAALREVERVERRLSTWRSDSELVRLNRSSPGQWLELSPQLAEDLAEALEWHERTGGAFSPTLGSLVRAWDLRGEGRVPGQAELAAARAAAHPRLLELTGERARRLNRGLAVDEGGFGKGIALRGAATAALEAGASCVTLNFGGQVVRAGNCKETKLDVAHPHHRGRPVASIRLTNGSVATSGNSERGLMTGGRAVGHILDPWSGCPVAGEGTVTVVTQDALAADVLSTALFVVGPARAAAWLQHEPEHRAVFALQGDAGVRLLVSEGLMGTVEVIDPQVRAEVLSTESMSSVAAAAGEGLGTEPLHLVRAGENEKEER